MDNRQTARMTGLVLPGILVLGAPALGQQPTVTLTPHWRAWPSNTAQILRFMDSAEVWVDAEIPPGIGSTVAYNPPPGMGTGTVAGLAELTFDIRVCDVPQGTWTVSGPGFHGATGSTFGFRQWGVFVLGVPGTPQASGEVLDIAGLQLVGPGMTPDPLNPVQEIWRGRWDYTTFPPGATARFIAFPRSASVFVHYDTVNGVPQYTIVPARLAAGDPVEIIFDTGAPPPCYIFVDDPPDDAAARSGDTVQFSVHAQQVPGSCGPITYRWRRDCTDLVDGGRISGATTSTLTIASVFTSDIGRYDVRIGGVHSHSAALAVSCYANCDGSTAAPILNVADFSCFLQQFAGAEPSANCDRSTAPPVLNVADFTCFLQQFAAGCP